MLGRRDYVYRAYWTFAAKRQQAFLARTAGAAAPWTDDAIIARFKFTNAFRASDRVSQFLIRDVIYQPGFSADDTLARIVLFRLFSKISTWRELERTLGPVHRRTVSSLRLAPVLEAMQQQGPIYTSAFILCANDAYGYRRKFMNHIALVRDMFARRALPKAIAQARALADVYRALLGYPLIGPFMAYQLAIDINYSELVDFDEDDFTVAGPGAERGIKKVFPMAERRDLRRIIDWMTANQEEEARRVGVAAPTLFGRPLHAIDCQNLFCELDKYARVAFPELKSNRSRIKTTFTETPEPLTLFYPPKWRINEGAQAHQAGLATQLALDVAA